MSAQHGRRKAKEDGGEGEPKSGWGEDTGGLVAQQTMMVNPDAEAEVEVPTLDGGADDGEVRPSEYEDMSAEVADAPTDYHSAMPKPQELELGKWAMLQQNTEFDLSCLTAVLASQLDDEDVPWNPDLLLVQLTSELISNETDDAGDAESQKYNQVSNAL